MTSVLCILSEHSVLFVIQWPVLAEWSIEWGTRSVDSWRPHCLFERPSHWQGRLFRRGDALAEAPEVSCTHWIWWWPSTSMGAAQKSHSGWWLRSFLETLWCSGTSRASRSEQSKLKSEFVEVVSVPHATRRISLYEVIKLLTKYEIRLRRPELALQREVY